jgi:fructose-bisphosphate aldolase class II
LGVGGEVGEEHGVRKINIDTDIRLAMTGAIRKHLNEHRDNFDPRQYLIAAKNAAKDICIERFQAFGCSEQASKIKPLKLSQMAKFYM